VHFVKLKKHLVKAFILNVTIVRCHKSDFLPVVFSAAAVGNFIVIVRKLFLSQTQTQTDDSAETRFNYMTGKRAHERATVCNLHVVT